MGIKEAEEPNVEGRRRSLLLFLSAPNILKVFPKSVLETSILSKSAREEYSLPLSFMRLFKSQSTSTVAIFSEKLANFQREEENFKERESSESPGFHHDGKLRKDRAKRKHQTRGEAVKRKPSSVTVHIVGHYISFSIVLEQL